MGDDRAQLKEVLAEKANETASKPTDVIMLYDSSGSVSEVDFQMALQAGIRFINTFGSDTAIGICQFSDTCVIECGITQDRSLLSKAHYGMKKQDEGTNTTEALQKAQMMMAFARSHASKIVYLFTDGQPNNQASAVAAGRALHAMGVLLIGVGIGSVSKANLTEVCVGGSTYVIDSYETLMKVVPTSPNISHYVPGSQLSFTYVQTKKPIPLKQKLPLEITIKNIGRTSVHPDSILEIEGGEFYDKHVQVLRREVKPEGEETFQVLLKPTGRADITNLPKKISLKIIHPDGLPYKMETTGFYTVLENMIGDIIEWKPPIAINKKANILIFGTTGAGKSTLINRIFFLWHETFLKKAASYDDHDHVTKETKYHEEEHLRFRFFDSVGLSEDNYQMTHFKSIINGSLPIGFKVNENKELSTDMLQMESAQEREIHSIIFVVPQGFRFFETAQPEKINRLRHFILEAVRADLSPIVVVTRLDEVEEDEREDLKPKFSKLTGVSENDVYLVDNSEKEVIKELEKQKVLYQILKKALDYSGPNMIEKAKKNPSPPQPASNPSSPSSINSTPEKSFPPDTPQSSQGISSMMDSLTIADYDSKDEFEMFGEFSLEQLLTSLRPEVEAEIGEFEFINSKTGNAVKLSQENKAKIKNISNQEKIFIRRNTPPKYS